MSNVDDNDILQTGLCQPLAEMVAVGKDRAFWARNQEAPSARIRACAESWQGQFQGHSWDNTLLPKSNRVVYLAFLSR